MPLRFHGAGTAFTGLVSQEVFNTVVTPDSILSRLAWIPSNVENPQVSYLVRLDTAPSGSAPTTKCATCQVVGEVASCVAIFPYARYCLSSPAISPEEFATRYNQGEIDLEIIGNLISPEVRELLGRGEVTSDAVTQSGIALAMLAVARSLFFQLSADVWTGGGPAPGGIWPMAGLDGQIRVEVLDAISGDECPNMASLVYDYDNDYNATDGTGSALAALLFATMDVLRRRAMAFGFGDVQWAIVVPPELKYYMSLAWAGMYTATFGYTYPTGHVPSVDLSAVARERDRMLSEDVIAIGGRQYPFIGDPGIPTTTSSGKVTGNIYIIPLTGGGRKLTYMNYLDMKGTPELSAGYAASVVTDAGRVLWYTSPTGGLCFNVTGVIRPRVVLVTPYLAAKITNVDWPAVPFPYPAPVLTGGVTERGLGGIPPSP